MLTSFLIYAIYAIIIAALFLIPRNAMAQSTTTGTLGSGWGVIVTDNVAVADSNVLMGAQRAADSIAAIKASITALSIKTDTLFTAILNSGVRLSTIKNYLVCLYVNISVVSALAGTNSGSIKLQRSPDNSTWVDITGASIVSNVGVLSTQINTQLLMGLLPAGYYYKIVSASAGVNGGTFTALLSNAVSQ